MSWFKSTSPKEQMRQNDRQLKHTQRDLDRDRRELDRQEKSLELEIKKMAREGNRQACQVLAKQLVNLRKQRTKSFGMSAKVSAIGSQSKAMQSNVRMAGAMKTTTNAMVQMNKSMNPMKIAKDMQEFEKQNTKMEMSEELIGDTLDNILEESGDEEESDRIVNQVLDEIGIEIAGKMPSAARSQVGEASSSKSKGLSDADIERMLENLKN